MDRKKIAKHITESKNEATDKILNNETRHPDHPESRFFNFVDKNPLIRNNTREAVLEYILSTHSIPCTFTPQIDETYDSLTRYLTVCHLHDPNK